MATEAKPAMDAATASCYDEGSASVLGEQTGRERGTGFAERVVTEPLHFLRFRSHRQDLSEQGIVRIARANPLEVGPRHEHSQRSCNAAGLIGNGGGQIEKATEFARVGDRLGQYGLPLTMRCSRARIRSMRQDSHPSRWPKPTNFAE